MANFAGRRAPNVSQYIANLNVVQSKDENTFHPDETFDFEHDLNMFTNTEFLDFPVDESIEFHTSGPEQLPLAEAAARQDQQHGRPGLAKTDYEYNMTELMSPTSMTSVPAATASPTYPQNARPLPFNVSTANSNLDPSLYNAPVHSPSSVASPTNAKRFEEDTKAAAEEDKRRRNTAASARFRVKKKQREQALESSVKEMTNKISAMEKRIGQLEQENGFLRDLVTEKSGKEGMAEKYRKFRKASEETDDSPRSTGRGKKGVGT